MTEINILVARDKCGLACQPKARLPVLLVAAYNAPHPSAVRFRWYGCGFALAEQGADTRLIQDYLRYRSMQHTVMDTAPTPPAWVKRLWW